MEKRKVHIEDLFTSENEEKGIWIEPVINGKGIGIELLVVGGGTDEAMADDEHYESLYTEAEQIKDPIQRKHKQMEVDAERCARLVKGIRPAKNCDVDFGGKEIEYSVPFIEELFLKSPLIKKYVATFASKTANFIKRESND